MTFQTNTTNQPVRPPVPAYPHLNPTPASGPPVIVQTGLADVNMKGPRANWPASIGYVLFKLSETRTRPSRVMFRSQPVETWRLGTTIWLQKAGTMENLGEYMIVGLMEAQSGEYAGQIPDRLTKACVMV